MELRQWMSAGQWVDNRDSVDARLIAAYRTGIGTMPPTEDSVGGFPQISGGTPYADSDREGMPDTWERLYGLNPASAIDGPLDADGDGYTNIEKFLNAQCV